MNTFKELDFGHKLHIGKFSVGNKDYEIYFSEITENSNTYVVLPEGITAEGNRIYAVAFDCIDNQRGNKNFARQNVGSKAILVFRQVVSMMFMHYEEHHPEFYCFSAIDDNLETIYQLLLSILVRKNSGFIVQRALGDKDYVIRTPVSVTTSSGL